MQWGVAVRRLTNNQQIENFRDKTISQYVIEIQQTGKVLSLKEFDITI